MSVEIHKASQYVIATIREDIKKPQLHEILHCLAEAEQEKAKAVILDMVGVAACEEFCLQEIVRTAQKLKEKDMYVFVVRLGHAMLSKIQRGGLGQILIFRNSIDEALTDVGIDAKSLHKLDSEFVKAVLENIVKVISDKAQTTAQPGHLFKNISEDKFKPEIITVLGLVSSTFNGSVAIAFQAPLFNAVSSKILGEEEKDGEDSDPGNRLLSEIHKNIAASLAPKNHFIQQFIPIVIRGDGLQMTEVTPDPILIIPYETSLGSFQIYIGLNSD